VEHTSAHTARRLRTARTANRISRMAAVVIRLSDNGPVRLALDFGRLNAQERAGGDSTTRVLSRSGRAGPFGRLDPVRAAEQKRR